MLKSRKVVLFTDAFFLKLMNTVVLLLTKVFLVIFVQFTLYDFLATVYFFYIFTRLSILLFCVLMRVLICKLLMHVRASHVMHRVNVWTFVK